MGAGSASIGELDGQVQIIPRYVPRGSSHAAAEKSCHLR